MPSLAATLAPLEAPTWEAYDRPQPAPRGVPAGATITRQFSLWPFGTRVLKLFLLCDPSPWDAAVGQALLRAMQQEYFRSEARSQTNALRSGILAAHFALKERNQSRLAHERATATAVCAVTRGTTAYVALAGEAAALSWSNGALSMHRAPVRVARPLGAEGVPRVVFWSAPLGPGDRLALVCGAAWKDDSADAVADLMREPHEAIREHLELLLAGSDGPARVWLAEGPASAPNRGRLTSVGAISTPPAAAGAQIAGRDPATPSASQRGSRTRRTRRSWAIAAGALAAVGLAAVSAHQALDWRSQTSLASVAAPAARTWRVANLGQAAGNVVDLVVGDGAAYALDVQGQVVLRFGLVSQGSDDGSIAVRRGAAVGRGSLEAPTAITWVNDGQGHGQLAVLDRARSAVLIAPSGDMRRIELPGAGDWKSVDAIEGGRDVLYVLDRAAARIIAYEQLDGANGPRARDVATSRTAPDLRLDQVDDIVSAGDLYLRYADGSIKRIDQQGRQLPFEVSLPNGPLGPVSGVALDGTTGLYLLDAQHGCVIQVTLDGHFVRELQLGDAGPMDSSRLLHSGADGQHLVYVDAAGITAIDMPGAAVPQVGGARL